MFELIKDISNLMILPEIKLLLGFLLAFLITYIAIPSIITVAEKKNLVDEPGDRSVHASRVPTLGGIAIFAGIAMSLHLMGDFYAYIQFKYIMAAAIVLFFVGIKDDILIIAPITKLIGQIIAASLLVIFADIRFTYLHGFWNIHEINFLTSYLLSVFVMIVIINGMNLIDGVDGLASGLGILITLNFAAYFYLVKEFQLSLMAIAVAGAYLAFYRFNVYSLQNKIFMGDTGSLLLGLFITILVIAFNEYNIYPENSYYVHSAPSVSFGFLAVPLFDIIRVMLIRIGLGRSPFKPDRNHIHHKLLRLGYSHRKITFILVLFNLFFILFAYHFQYVSIRRLLLLILAIAMFLSYLPDFINQRKKRNYETP
jgi:UDP-N-acetylmuramyl pentapeptide phosphotransferase/UDP-N-acetylglucosamine-1-phosphate transferase